MRKLAKLWTGPYTVISKPTAFTYEIQDNTGKLQHVNGARLKLDVAVNVGNDNVNVGNDK